MGGTLYSRCRNLTHYFQDPENKQWFTPDALMKPIFGSERQKCFGMSKHLKEHLTNPDK